VSNFKYLGIDINSPADNHEEIHRTITARNKWYFSLDQLFKSKKLSRRIKIERGRLKSYMKTNYWFSKRKSGEEYWGQREVRKTVTKYGQIENLMLYSMIPISYRSHTQGL